MFTHSSGILELDYPSLHNVSDHDYDDYEGFDAYPIFTMPIYIYDPAIVDSSKKKEIIYL